MEDAPLDLLRPAIRVDLAGFLRAARGMGLRLAVWSDYPAARKLEALGLAEYFDIVVCAQDSAVRRFKPDPRGMEVLLERLSLSADEIIYIGDRPEVDGVAAMRAGVRCFIIGNTARPEHSGSFTSIKSFSEVLKWLMDEGRVS
jgi:FMN phosphatase YigB (HAD superfamily)